MEYNPRKRLLETRLFEDEFVEKLRLSLAGGEKTSKVVWASAENELVVNLEKLQVAVQAGKIIVGLEVECDQYGTCELVLPFGVGNSFDNSFLLAVTPKTFGGHQGVAATWGEVAAKFVWRACLAAMEMKWDLESGLDDFQIKGLVADKGSVHGLFSYPEGGGEEEPPETSVADIVDSLELAQIHLGKWKGGNLKPIAVHKVGGKVDSVKFAGGAVMKGAEVAALMKQKKIAVDTVVAVKRQGKLYLRGVPDKEVTDVLDLPPIFKK